MEMNEFLQEESSGEIEVGDELDVQKAVVESLAADKAEQSERISALQKENYLLKTENATLKSQIEEMRVSLAKVGDILAKNSEAEVSNKVSLLERDVELADRFQGETRDQVLEVIKEARDVAEKTGRIRRAQLLEGVLLANEPIGTLAKKRAALEQFFAANSNILNGTVIAELEKCGISYKKGEEYLLTKEILNRTY